MTINDMNDPSTMAGAPVYDIGGNKLGSVDAIFLDDRNGKPEWAAVKTVSIVPLKNGDWDGETLHVPFNKDQLEASPHHNPDSQLNETEMQDLYRHYGMDAEAEDTEDADSSHSGKGK